MPTLFYLQVSPGTKIIKLKNVQAILVNLSKYVKYYININTYNNIMILSLYVYVISMIS